MLSMWIQYKPLFIYLIVIMAIFIAVLITAKIRTRKGANTQQEGNDRD